MLKYQSSIHGFVGTIVAIMFTSASYILIGWVTASVTLRHASGNVADIMYGNLTACEGNHDNPCSDGSINNYYVRPGCKLEDFITSLKKMLKKIFNGRCKMQVFCFYDKWCCLWFS